MGTDSGSNGGSYVAKYDGATIEIVNWGKYNPRLDSKRPSWFRLETSFVTGQECFDLPPNQKWGWVTLMSAACEKNGMPFTLRYKWLRFFTTLVDDEIDELIDFFIGKGALRVTRASVAQESPPTNQVSERDAPATDGRTDETDETDETDTARAKRTRRRKLKGPPESISYLDENRGPYETCDSLRGDPEVEALLSFVSLDTQERWLKLYPPDVITRECLKAISWLEDNRDDEKHSIGRFVSNWLSRTEKNAKTGVIKFPSKQEQISQSNLALLDEIRGAR